MGYFGKIELKNKAKRLRKRGFSMRQIQKKLGVSRSSVSLWVRDIRLTKSQINRLYRNKKTGGLKGSYIASQNKIKARKEKNEEIIKKAHEEVGPLTKRDRFLLGVALYFGEGSKTSHSVAFTNSNPSALVFIKNWLIEFCDVRVEHIRCNVYIHDNLDIKKAINYWIRLLGVKSYQFKKTYLVKNNPNRLRNSKHIYGICRITVSRVDILRRILGWISAAFFV